MRLGIGSSRDYQGELLMESAQITDESFTLLFFLSSIGRSISIFSFMNVSILFDEVNGIPVPSE